MVGRLKKIIENLRLKMKRHGKKTTFVFKNMATILKVFLRQDAPQPLQPPYDGPFLNRSEKTFKVKIRGKAMNVSDRLKLTYILQNFETLTDKKTQSTTTTRSGQPSKPPVRFK